METFIKWIISLFIKPETKATEPVKAPVENSNPVVKEWDLFFADISHHEDTFDVKKYNRPILINKCTDGISFVDNTHFKRRKDCEANNIIYIGYHFFQCYSDPIKQAEHYFKNHGEFKAPPQVDYEKDKDQGEDDLKKEVENLYICLCHIEKLTGKTPILYSYKSLLDYLELDQRFARFSLWIARYNSKLGEIPKPFTEKNLFAWQYSDGGETYSHAQYTNSFPGIGKCDSSIYYKSNDVLGLFKDKVN